MAELKKRLEIREPLTDEERRRELKYYSDDNIEIILERFGPRRALSRPCVVAEFKSRIETAATLFVEGAAYSNDKPPSVLERKWRALARRLSGVLTDLTGLTGQERGDLEYAAERLAERTGSLPDLDHDAIELPVPGPGTPSDDAKMYRTPFWPVAAQLEKCRSSIEWLRDCVEEARVGAASDIAESGNRPITPKHEFYQVTVGIYMWAAQNPRAPRPSPRL